MGPKRPKMRGYVAFSPIYAWLALIEQPLRGHKIAYATAILGHSEGPWHGLHRPRGHYVGPHGCPGPRIVTK